MTRVPRYKQRKNTPRPDKSTLWMPLCPFCGEFFKPPVDIPIEGFSDVFGGRCTCGAVYTCDPTGKNEGETFMDALALASGGYDEALELTEDDYEEKVLFYDLRRHRLVPRGYNLPEEMGTVRAFQRGIAGMRFAKLIFIKLKDKAF